MNIFITGGAGFVGSVLIPKLIEHGYKVKVLDNLIYNNGIVLLSYFQNKNFEFYKVDIRDKLRVKELIKKSDIIIHLAAIVGYPACKRNPKVAKEVNLDGTKILNELRSREQVVIFASTSSVYGYQGDNNFCSEQTPLNPLTVYARTKIQAEHILLDKGNVVILRFATGFGLSPRLRLDLLINNFVFLAFTEKKLVVYQKNYRRAFVHVRDMANAFIFSLKNLSKMVNEIYNVGADELNLTKEEIALNIKKKLDFKLFFSDVGCDEDQRNYALSYEKIRHLGFKAKISLNEGIDEIISALRVIDVKMKNCFFSNV